MRDRNISNADIWQITALIRAAASVGGISPKIITGRSRSQPGAFMRQLAMAYTYRMTELTLSQIAESFGRLDHGTVSHAITRVRKGGRNDRERELLRRFEDNVGK